MATRKCDAGDPPGWLVDPPEDSPIKVVRHVGGLCFTVTRSVGWAEVARWCSIREGGMWRFRDVGVTWVCGRRRLWLYDPGYERHVLEARAAIEGLGLEPQWSVGGNAAEGLKWAIQRQQVELCARGLLCGIHEPYQCCLPGKYEHAVKYDVRAYYYSLLCSLPSPRVTPLPSGRVLWHRLRAQEQERWGRLLMGIGEAKLLRNALWGVMRGSRESTPYYFRGEKRLWRGSYGPCFAGAVYVARAAYELTLSAADQVCATYSHTDSVVTHWDRKPTIWEDVGLVVKEEAAGSAEICWPGCYRVGSTSSKWFQKGSRFPILVPRPGAPDRLYYPALLLGHA